MLFIKIEIKMSSTSSNSSSQPAAGPSNLANRRTSVPKDLLHKDLSKSDGAGICYLNLYFNYVIKEGPDEFFGVRKKQKINLTNRFLDEVFNARDAPLKQ